jgi:hypothetical protein
MMFGENVLEVYERMVGVDVEGPSKPAESFGFT